MSHTVIVHKSPQGVLTQTVEVESHSFTVDEPSPNPHDLLDAALGACTAITIHMVAQRKQWPLTDVRVQITHDEDDDSYRMHRKLELIGALSAEQRQFLLGIAGKCPVHRALHKKIEVDTALLPAE